jgi:hypothetical protein
MGEIKKRGRHQLIIDYFYNVDKLYVTIDYITTNFYHRFNELSSELLQNFSCLDSRDSFSRFNMNKMPDKGIVNRARMLSTPEAR